ncbi:MAG: transcriptional repressor [Planctomycetota bacterium]
MFDDATLKDVFHRHGMRYTRQRAAVYAALASTKSHPTAEELLTAVRGDEPGISLGTVYNTLETLIEMGLCQRLAPPSPAHAARYDADTSDHVHVAAADGSVIDLPTDLSERVLGQMPADLTEELADRLGAPIERLSVQVVLGDRNR